jgi:hypothetical protein
LQNGLICAPKSPFRVKLLLFRDRANSFRVTIHLFRDIHSAIPRHTEREFQQTEKQNTVTEEVLKRTKKQNTVTEEVLKHAKKQT